jgi:superfamily II DNA or RNA helicase
MALFSYLEETVKSIRSMNSTIILMGPLGAGKTTVALKMLSRPVPM